MTTQFTPKCGEIFSFDIIPFYIACLSDRNVQHINHAHGSCYAVFCCDLVQLYFTRFLQGPFTGIGTIIGRITIRLPKGGHTGSKMTCLVELHNSFQCIDYDLLHISEKFRSTVSCFNWEMPILLIVGLVGYIHYKKAHAILCGCIIQYFMDTIYKIAQR